MSGSITLRFKGKVKKICFRQNIPSEDFGCLIASHFDIKKRIIGLKDKQGTMVEIGYFCQKPYEIKPEIYQVIVEDRSHSQSQHRRNFTQSYNFQKQSPPLQNNFLQSAQLGSQIQTSDFASPQQQYLNRSLQVQSQDQRQNSLQQQQQQYSLQQQQQQPTLQSNIQSFQSPYNQTQQSYNNNNNIQNQINTTANYIEDLFEFYEGFLQGDFTQNQKLTAIFILDELTAASILEQYNNVIMEYSENADFFYTYNKEQNSSFIFNNINVAIPCLVLYKGNKKVIELSTTNKKDQIIRIFHNFTNTIIQPNFSSQLVQNSSLNANNDQDQDSFQQVIDIQDIQKNIIQYLDKMHSENLLDNPQYYYFTCQAFKNLNNFLKTLFDDLTDISYESFKENLKNQIRNMVRQDNSLQQKQQQQEQQFQNQQQQSQKLQYSSTQQLQISKQKQKIEQDDILDQITSSSNQNQEIPLRLYQEQINKISRPQTTGNQAQRKQKKRNLKKYNPDIDSYIEITEDLIDQNILEEQQGSIIKTFLLEENLEVLRVYNSYLSGIFNEQILQQKLKDLADKLGSYLERPSSPFPRKFQLIKTINTVLSQYFSPEQIKILNDLAQQGNEMIVSAFEVYESDKDFDEFIDTIKRILKVQSSSFFKQSGSSNINTFYVKDNQTNQNQCFNFFNQNPDQYQQQQQQQKQYNYNRQNRHQQDLQQQQQQLQQQQGGFSIFSNPNYKTTNYDNNNNQVNLSNKNTLQQQEQNQNIFTGQILPNNINNKLFSKEQQFFEFVEANIESIQPEEYGMLQYLYKILDEDLIKMVEQSHLHQKYDLFPIQMLAKQKLNEKMNLEFTKLELKQIYENQANNKTSTYSVYQQFQVEGDLNQFITNLKQALLLDQTQMLNNQLNEGVQSNLKVPVNTVNTNSKMDLFSKQDSFDNGNIFEQETPSLKNQEISDDIQFVKQNSQEVDSAKPYFQNEQKNKQTENQQTQSKQKENNYFQQRQNQINLQKQENFNSFSDSNQKANVNVNINNQSSSIYKINQIQKENKDSLQVNYSNHSSQNMGNGNQKKIIGMNSSLGVISPSSSKKKNLSFIDKLETILSN
ncbi:hypothetical protein PPERSA_06402 [Pseudocohnilembus persalinus]|uniref:Uncharacterized protein n=1 Tax=Pseudocohnilembus persalinus TaxID=266149 RepID=A0A0V0QRY1_PSEPJ|nr:hypothetical protein PPERSA_06402 [Pseudocohnilembus persalinus]|eukprot:KRX04768.1 hypothetical protein PPERSA_06402 [Pseudocohnilembus persalinus]